MIMTMPIKQQNGSNFDLIMILYLSNFICMKSGCVFNKVRPCENTSKILSRYIYFSMSVSSLLTLWQIHQLRVTLTILKCHTVKCISIYNLNIQVCPGLYVNLSMDLLSYTNNVISFQYEQSPSYTVPCSNPSQTL